MEREPLAEQRERAAAAIIAEIGTGGLSYEAALTLASYSWRAGALAGLERGKELAIEALHITHDELTGGAS